MEENVMVNEVTEEEVKMTFKEKHPKLAKILKGIAIVGTVALGAIGIGAIGKAISGPKDGEQEALPEETTSDTDYVTTDYDEVN